MNIFDCHFHIETGLINYNLDNVFGKNVIFNYVDNYFTYKDKLSATDTVSLIFDYQNNFDIIKELLTNNKLNALKIHSRIQHLAEIDYPSLLNALMIADPKVPVIVDAFYFGDDLEYQPSLKFIVNLAKKFPHLPVIVAHSGGYEVLKYFYHLKTLQNIYFDLSFSLTYLKNTSVNKDFANLIQYGNPEHLIFGTDYPFINAKNQFNAFIEIADQVNLSVVNREKILFSNSLELFTKNLKH